MKLEKLNIIFCKIVSENRAFHRVAEKTKLGIGLDMRQKTNIERIEYNVSRDRLILSSVRVHVYKLSLRPYR